MAAALDDLAAYLVAEGIGAAGTTLFRFALTPDPDSQVAVIPYSGLASEQAFGEEGWKWEHPRLQVVSRGPKTDPRAAWTKAHDAYLAVGRISAQAINGAFWHHAIALQPPFSMGQDDNGRPLFGFNVSCTREVPP